MRRTCSSVGIDKKLACRSHRPRTPTYCFSEGCTRYADCPADLAGGAHEGLEVVGAHGRGLVVGEPRHEQLVLRVAEQRGEAEGEQQCTLLLALVALRVV